MPQAVELETEMLDYIYAECLAAFSQVICTPEEGYKRAAGGFGLLISDMHKVAEIAAGKRKPDFPIKQS